MGNAKKKASPPGVPKLKIAVGVPSGAYWHADMAMSMIGLMTTSLPHVGLACLSQRGSQISKQRNDLVERAMEAGADYLLQVDSDMTFPPDALMRLLAHKKDIVGATYNKRVPPYETLGYMDGPAPPPGVALKGLIPALFMPGGMMLVKMSVYNKIPYPWYAENYDTLRFKDKCMSEDYYFCEKARQHGFAVWCSMDITVQMGHIGEQIVTCLAPPETEKVVPYRPAAE